MSDWFAVDNLDVERLLTDWRWLCPNRMSLVARDAFGDLFLRDESGQIHRLDVAIGELLKIADSEAQFRDLAATHEKRQQWFWEAEEQAAFARGLKPSGTQCIGFSIPLVFSQSGSPDTPYVADLYEHISFLGLLNRQIASLPDGTPIQLVIGPKPPSTQNRAIEIHDSVLDQITLESGLAVLHFLKVYIHSSEGRPAIDEGTGWVQEAFIRIGNAQIDGMFSPESRGSYGGEGHSLYDGSLLINGSLSDNLIPVPLDVQGDIELSLKCWDEVVRIRGNSAKLELIGTAKYVEEFHPSK